MYCRVTTLLERKKKKNPQNVNDLGQLWATLGNFGQFFSNFWEKFFHFGKKSHFWSGGKFFHFISPLWGLKATLQISQGDMSPNGSSNLGTWKFKFGDIKVLIWGHFGSYQIKFGDYFLYIFKILRINIDFNEKRLIIFFSITKERNTDFSKPFSHCNM
jgi:hypothetical protein